jgi:hypothetical protein
MLQPPHLDAPVISRSIHTRGYLNFPLCCLLDPLAAVSPVSSSSGIPSSAEKELLAIASWELWYHFIYAGDDGLGFVAGHRAPRLAVDGSLLPSVLPVVLDTWVGMTSSNESHSGWKRA